MIRLVPSLSRRRIIYYARIVCLSNQTHAISFHHLSKVNLTSGKSYAFYIAFCFSMRREDFRGGKNIKRLCVLTCNFMARKLVDSFEGGVFLKRARGHQNNFIGGHVKGAFRRRGCDLARATSMLHLVDQLTDYARAVSGK